MLPAFAGVREKLRVFKQVFERYHGPSQALTSTRGRSRALAGIHAHSCDLTRSRQQTLAGPHKISPALSRRSHTRARLRRWTLTGRFRVCSPRARSQALARCRGRSWTLRAFAGAHERSRDIVSVRRGAKGQSIYLADAHDGSRRRFVLMSTHGRCAGARIRRLRALARSTQRSR